MSSRCISPDSSRLRRLRHATGEGVAAGVEVVVVVDVVGVGEGVVDVVLSA